MLYYSTKLHIKNAPGFAKEAGREKSGFANVDPHQRLNLPNPILNSSLRGEADPLQQGFPAQTAGLGNAQRVVGLQVDFLKVRNFQPSVII